MNQWTVDLDELPLQVGYFDPLQQGIWLRLLLWCKASKPERSLPDDLVTIEHSIGVPGERRALEAVLARCYEHAEGQGYTRKPLLLEQASRAQALRAANERRQASRERRSALFEQARAMGLTPSFRATMGELEAMLNGHQGKQLVSVSDSTSVSVSETARSLGESLGFTPVPLSSPSLREVEGENARAGTRAGAACRAMRRAGLPEANPSHPGLMRLLDAGVSDEEFAMAAAECVARGKASFAYVLATVEGRRRDAASKAPVAPAVDLLAQWAPSVAAMRDAAWKES